MKFIYIASSKGGVGKSLITINVAYALHKMGYRTGLLDTDLAMPAIVKYLDIEGTQLETHKKLEPVLQNGVELLSAGLIMGRNQPVVINSAKREELVAQFIDKSNWNVDYLVIDTPPGATDELRHIIANRRNELKGIIVVTTPSQVAISQVRRSLELFSRMKVPILGIIGNMTGLECDSCHHINSVSKNGSADPIEQLAKDFNVKVLCSLPTYMSVDQDPLHFVDVVAGGLKNAGL